MRLDENLTKFYNSLYLMLVNVLRSAMTNIGHARVAKPLGSTFPYKTCNKYDKIQIQYVRDRRCDDGRDSADIVFCVCVKGGKSSCEGKGLVIET